MTFASTSYLAVVTTILASSVPSRLSICIISASMALMLITQEEGKMETNEYFVIGLWEGIWDASDPTKYFHGLLQDKEDFIGQKRPILDGFNNYLGVIMSPPVESQRWSYGHFKRLVTMFQYFFFQKNVFS